MIKRKVLGLFLLYTLLLPTVVFGQSASESAKVGGICW
jgi:hypothetical protein